MTSTTRQHEQATGDAREDAIQRIRTIMLPGAQTLADSRRRDDPSTLTREVDLADGSWLRWYTSEYDRMALVSLCDKGNSPESLARLATIARDTTAAIVRECEARMAEAASLSAALIAAYEGVAR